MPYGAINLQDVNVQQCPVHAIDGIEVSEVPAAEYIQATSGPAKAEVRNVRGELVIPMNGCVPEEWSLL